MSYAASNEIAAVKDTSHSGRRSVLPALMMTKTNQSARLGTLEFADWTAAQGSAALEA